MPCARPCWAHSQYCGTDFVRKVISMVRIQWLASHLRVAIIPVQQSSPRLTGAKLVGDDYHRLKQSQVELEDTRDFAPAFSWRRVMIVGMASERKFRIPS